MKDYCECSKYEVVHPLSEAQKQELSAEITPEFIKDYQESVAYYEKHPENCPVIAVLGSHNTSITYAPGEDKKYQYVQCLNGANIKDAEGIQIQCELLDNGVAFQMNNDLYLGDVFDRLPYGVIKKNKTGVGATSLELAAPRNSIIVLPTKAMAYGKAVSGLDETTGKYQYLYVGSAIEGASHHFPDIADYLSTVSITYKKFLVVADSLKKVLTALGPAKNDYFLMVDEVDIYQTDSTFRPSLENVIDYYFQFSRYQRCLVSATIQAFSNPRINCEPFIEITYPKPNSRDITLIHTQNPHAVITEKIEELLQASDTEKIVVAYNKVKFIRYIIQNLNENHRNECAILCSEASRNHAGSYYAELQDKTLPKRVNFITNPFFAGIDFMERFHLISASNASLTYTLLSPNRLTQIAGRCRHKNGLFSETIVYTTQPSAYTMQPESYLEYLKVFAKNIVDYINQAQKLTERYHKPHQPTHSLLDASFQDIQKVIMEQTKHNYYQSGQMSLVRQNVVTREYCPAYFCIDALYESVGLAKNLYASADQLYEMLNRHNHVVFKEESREYTQAQAANDAIVDQEYQQEDQNQIDTLVQQLKVSYDALGSQYSFLQRLLQESNRTTRPYIERFLALYPYIPKERLLEADIEHFLSDERRYRGYYNAVIFWALDEDHPFKKAIKYNFPETAELTRAEIKSRLVNIYSKFLEWDISDKSESETIKLLGELIQTDRGCNTRRNTRRIVSHNKWHFEGEPLNKIVTTQDVKKLIKRKGHQM